MDAKEEKMKIVNGDLLLEILEAERDSCCAADKSGLERAIEILKEQDPVEAPARLICSLEISDEQLSAICGVAVDKYFAEHPDLLGDEEDQEVQG